MSTEHFISIIVPAYNCETMVGNCLKALLDQDYPKDDYEIIIVDNNSKDRTAEIIKSYPVKYFLQKDVQTSYASRNMGIQKAKGDIIAFTDSDCIPRKDWLSKAVRGFEDGVIGCVAGEIEADTPQNYVEAFLTEKNTLAQSATIRNPFLPYPQTANALYRRDVFDKIGLFETKWASGGDGDLAWRMQLNTDYKIQYVPESVVLHRHRSTLRSMFRQKVKWGIGRTNHYKKYRDKFKKRRVKETWWDFKTFLSLFWKMTAGYFKKSNPESATEQRQRNILVFLNYAGAKLGELIGSVRNGVYYV